MNVLLIALLMVVSVPTLRADSGEPLRVTHQSSLAGLLRVSHRDTSHCLVIYPRPAWETTTPTLAVSTAGPGSLKVCASDIDVLDAAYWRGSILVLHRHRTGLYARVLSLDGRRVIAEAMIPPPTTNDTQDDTPTSGVRLMVSSDEASAVILSDGLLCRPERDGSSLSFTTIEQRVTAAGFVGLAAGAGLVYTYRIGTSAYLSLADSSLHVRTSLLVPVNEISRIEQVGENVILYSELGEAGGCMMTVLNLRTQTTSTRTLPVAPSRVVGLMVNSLPSLAVLTSRSGHVEVVLMPLSRSLDRIPPGTLIPGDYGSPVMLRASGDTVIAIFSAGVAMVNTDGRLLSRDALEISCPASSEFQSARGLWAISSPMQSVVLRLQEQPFWFLWRSWDALLRYVIPLLFIVSMASVLYMYRRQRRFLEAIIDTPGAGIVLFIDVNGRLVRVNDRAAAALRITTDVPMGRMFESYMQQPELEQLHQFIDRVRHSRESHTDKITTTKADDQREYMISSTPILGTFGSVKGMLFAGIDITETLEQRRLVNWAQLAHDMQTNLSTIRLNAEQFRGDTDSGDDERRRRILFQVGVLIDRVRDLLGVARSDVFQRATVHSAELCTEVRHEFDPSMFPHVTFIMKLRGTLMQADRLKLSRAVRNAVENAIKALRGQPGTVEIATWFDRTNVFISVSDTGVGMDPETMANMMKPYFSTSSDGSGHGIGTMIMHHVTKLHGGTIRVTSDPGKGTQVVFRIPHGMEPKEKLRSVLSERAA